MEKFQISFPFLKHRVASRSNEPRVVDETQRAGSRLNESPVAAEGRKAAGSASSLRKNANAYLYYRQGGQEHVEFERRIDSREESYDGTFRSYVSFPRMQEAIQIKDFTLERHRFPIVS